YLYKPFSNEPYNIIPWDFDRTFDFDFKDLFYGQNDIIIKLLTNKTCFDIYKNYLIYILNNIFKENILFHVIDSEYGKIKDGYYLDPYLGLAGNNLENEIVKIKNFVSDRRQQMLNGINNFVYRENSGLPSK
ncbi:MAG: CotH kinase family protein, partial [Ignavibacteriaceae bacterium]